VSNLFSGQTSFCLVS